MEKKLLIVLRNLDGGGAERVALNLINNLKKNEKYKITLFLIKNSGVYFSELDDEVNVIFGSKYRLSVSFPIILLKLFFACLGKKHLISGTEGEPTYFLNLIGFLQFKKPINWVHISLSVYLQNIHPIHKVLTYFHYILPSKIVCVSEGVKEDHLQLFPNKKDIHVIHNILNHEFILEKSKDINLLNINLLNKNYFCAVGRLSYQKGFDILIQSMKILVNKYPHINLQIFGSGPLEKELNNLILSLNLQNNVRLMGFEKEIYQKIKNSKGLIMPSRYEGCGMVLLEAMLLSVPVIATDCPYGPKEIIGESEYGLLVSKMNSPSLLAKTIEDLILMPEFSISLLKEKALTRTKDFLPEKIIFKWNNILSMNRKIN
jgi:glycosyltransferase involved in cell wall biosynthesis